MARLHGFPHGQTQSFRFFRRHRFYTRANNRLQCGIPGDLANHLLAGDRAIQVPAVHRWRSGSASRPRAGSCRIDRSAKGAALVTGDVTHFGAESGKSLDGVVICSPRLLAEASELNLRHIFW